jgi:hypothetical protein
VTALPEDNLLDELELGTAGASSRREQERRRANRERRTREKHPRIGGALLALRSQPVHERAWGTGADGEEATAAFLVARCPRALILHDRRIAGRGGNIDHVAVAPSGVWVIDSKRYKGRKVCVERPLLGKEKLVVGGRDCTQLVDALRRQVQAVGAVMAGIDPAVPVRGALCFVEAELPLLGTPTVGGLPVLARRGMAKRLNGAGPLTDERVRAIAAELVQVLPAA